MLTSDRCLDESIVFPAQAAKHYKLGHNALAALAKVSRHERALKSAFCAGAEPRTRGP